jgi:hypothetical protein
MTRLTSGSNLMRKSHLLMALFYIAMNATTYGADDAVPRIASTKEFIPFAQKNCLSCHDGEDQKGGFDMEDLLKQPTVEKNPALWHSVLERIASRDMPPKKRKERPTEAEYQEGENWVRTQLEAYEAFAAIQRPRPMRRLNSDEYNRTIQEVFGLPGVTPASNFPPDDAFEGFTNIGEALNLSSVLVDQYFSAGEAVAKLALNDGTKPEAKTRVFTQGNKDYSLTIRGHDPGGAIHDKKWIGDHLFVEFNAPIGTYAVRLIATPKNLETRPGYIPHFQYRANDLLVYKGDVKIQNDVPMKQEFQVFKAENGRFNIDFRWANGFPYNNDLRAEGLRLPEWSGKEAHSRTRPWNYLEHVYKPALKADPKTPYPFPYFDDLRLEVEGPLFPDGWPLSRFQRENAAAIAAKDAVAIARWLLPKLYRRPITADEVTAFATFVDHSEKFLATAKPQPSSVEHLFSEALRLGIQQALLSPHFLFIVEPGPMERSRAGHAAGVFFMELPARCRVVEAR